MKATAHLYHIVSIKRPRGIAFFQRSLTLHMLINVWADIMYIIVIYEKSGEGAFIRDNTVCHSGSIVRTLTHRKISMFMQYVHIAESETLRTSQCLESEV